MTLVRWISGLTLLCAATAAQGLTLEFPMSAKSAAAERDQLASYVLPVGPARAGDVPVLSVEGQVLREAWHLDSKDATTLQILTPLRDQLSAAGFDTLFECDTQECGGFDFRYGMDVLPEPAMHVNLGDFRYLVAQRQTVDGPEQISLLVSRAGQMGFAHVVHVGHNEIKTQPTVTASTKSAPTVELPTDLGGQLETVGRVVLSDLNFATGSSALDGVQFASLHELAAYLQDNPTRRVVLVGHTDAEGALDGNIALSKKRASSVRDWLITELGVPSEQIAAEGVGYLVPVASNLTNDGRDLNRRVEAILESTE